MRPAAPTDLKPFFLTLHDLDAEHGGRLDWSALFENDQPVELDVGSGRGLFLVRSGIERPDTNFLGVELDYKEGRRAARRLQKRQLPNVRVLGGDVHLAFRRYFPSRSVRAIHVYFPDPWWKPKHRRRRVFNDHFADECARLLIPGGLLYSRTDVKDYFEVISALMDNHPAFDALPPPPLDPPQHDMDYHTSFERRKRKAGLPIYRGLWRTKPAASDS